MRELSDQTIKMLVFRDPTLKQAADRYKYCWTLLPDAVYELDIAVKKSMRNNYLEDTPQIQFLRENVELITQEMDISEGILRDALSLEYQQFESP
jgi:hypothetical protein